MPPKRPRTRTRKSPRREPLTPDRVVASAIAIADAHGLAALSMRAVAEALGVQAMSLYNHVDHKDALLDRMVDAVFAEIEVPTTDDWPTALRTRARAMYAALRAHPWAIGLLDARRTPGPTTLGHHDRTIGVLRGAGLSTAMVQHAVALLDAYVYGFALQELSLPLEPDEDVPELARDFLSSTPMAPFPHLAWLATEHVSNRSYSFSDEFEFGLELILEGLARAARGRG